MNLAATGGWVSAGQHGHHLASPPCPDRKVSQRPETTRLSTKLLEYCDGGGCCYTTAPPRGREIYISCLPGRIPRRVCNERYVVWSPRFTSSDVMGRSSFVLCFSSDAMHTSKPSPILRNHAEPSFFILPHRSLQVCY